MQYFQAGQIVRDAVSETLPLIPEAEGHAAAHPPLQHIGLEQGHFARESKNEWDLFQRIILPSHITESITPEEMVNTYGNLLMQFRHYMIHVDIKHIQKGRPKRLSPSRTYASLLREYVLDGLSTGSPSFNAIFSDMRRVILANPPADITYLATLWQSRHNGDEFYPTGFIADAEAQGTRELFGYSPDLTFYYHK